MLTDPRLRLVTLRLYIKRVITKEQSLDYQRRAARGECAEHLLAELAQSERVFTRRQAMHIVKD